MKSVFSRPLMVTGVSLAVAAIAGLIVVPMIGNPPKISPELAALAQEDASSAQSSSTVAVASGTSISLSFQATGKVASVSVKEGDAVATGTILASLDASVASAAVNQAKAALDLAVAQYGSASLAYSNAKTSQDTLVENAYRTLLSTGLAATPVGTLDESHNPAITGTYTCDKKGSYEIDTYASGATSNYSFSLSGLEAGGGIVTFGTPQPLGTCGLYVTFVPGFSGATKWIVDIPNTLSSAYQADKNAYDIAVATRDQTLSQLAASIGADPSVADAAVSEASVTVAESAYKAALAQYANDLITAPASGIITFIDTRLRPGQAVTAGQGVMTLTVQ